jgi:predicted DNA-binding transcriptional regulator AlpA
VASGISKRNRARGCLFSFLAPPALKPGVILMSLPSAGSGVRHHLDRRADELAQWVAEGDPDDLLKPKVLERVIGVSGATLENWRRKKIGPPFVRLGPRQIRYRRGDLVAWVRSRRPQAEVPKTKSMPTKIAKPTEPKPKPRNGGAPSPAREQIK